jgi:hypothetical protein
VVGSIIKSFSITKTQIIKVTPAINRSTGHILTQFVKVVHPAVGIIKLLVEEYAETVKLISSFTKTTGINITLAVKVMSDKLYDISKALIESIVISEIYTNALIAYRTLSETIKVWDERNFNIGKIFSNTINIGSNCLTEFGKIYEQVISVVSSMGSFIISKVWNETVIVN